MSMVFLGVPILDWVLLVVLLGLGVEAWLTCRVTDDDKERSAAAPDRAGTDRNREGG